MAKKSSTTHNLQNVPMVNRLSSVINPQDYQAEYKKPNEYMGRPIIIFGYEMMPGKQGDFAHIECLDVMTENPVIISTGGGLILKALNDIQSKNGFPILTTFAMSGNAYVFADAPVGKGFDLNGMVSRYLFGDEPDQSYIGQEFPQE